MIPNERGRLFKTLRRLHGHNVDSGLNDLTEAFASFMTRARYFSIGHLRRTWSHSAVEFMKYRRRLPQILAGGDEDSLSKFDLNRSDEGTSSSSSGLADFNVEANLSRRVYVTNVPSKVTTTQLASFFSKFGKVVSCSVPVDRATSTLPRRSKGSAFVTFKSTDEAERAKKAPPSELTLYDKVMVVTQAVHAPKKRHSEHWSVSRPGLDEFDRNVPLASGEDNESIVSESETEQTSTPSSPSLSVPSINVLPNRVLLQTFSYLGLVDRCRVERVCKRWQELSFESWKTTTTLSFRNMVSLFRSRPLQNPTFKLILHRCGPHLNTLDLSGAPQFLNEQSLTIVASTCRKLKHINLTGVKVDWKALKIFAESCAGLETIIYRDAYFLSEKGFWWLFRYCANLKTIDLGNAVNMTGRCFRLLGTSLENICLDGCRRLHPAAIEEMCLKSSNVRRLIVDDCVKLTNASLSLISRTFANLEAFSMRGGPFPSVNGGGLCQIGRLTNLCELHLDRNKCVNDAVLRAVADGCSQTLRCITLSQAGANDSLTRGGLLELQLCTKLNELDLSFLSAVTDVAMERLTAANVDLETVRLRGCTYVGDNGIESLVRNCIQLQDLDISGCLAVTNRSIQKFFDVVGRTTTLTITLGGTSCEVQKLFRQLDLNKSIKVILDTVDTCRSQLRSGFEFHMGSSNEMVRPETEYYCDDDDFTDDNDEFESLTAQRAFVLDELEEDDVMPNDEGQMDENL